MAAMQPKGAKVTDKFQCNNCILLVEYPCDKTWCHHKNDLCEDCDNCLKHKLCWTCLDDTQCDRCSEYFDYETGCFHKYVTNEVKHEFTSFCKKCCKDFHNENKKRECCYCKKKKLLISDCIYCKKCAREHCMLSGTDSFTSSKSQQ
jgi:hypothetical protein